MNATKVKITYRLYVVNSDILSTIFQNYFEI